MNKIYIASTKELASFIEHEIIPRLEAKGFEVVSSWSRTGEKYDTDHAMSVQNAEMNCTEIRRCDTIIVFESEKKGRGGHEFEAGYAYGIGKRVIVIGYTQNNMLKLVSIEHFPTWDHFFNHLGQ